MYNRSSQKVLYGVLLGLSQSAISPDEVLQVLQWMRAGQHGWLRPDDDFIRPIILGLVGE